MKTDIQNREWYDLDKDRFFTRNLHKTIENSTTPLTLCFHIGYQCNLHCVYCSSKGKEISDLKQFDQKELIDFVQTYKIKRVVISGGEPFLYIGELFQVLAALKEANAYTIVATNGTQNSALDPELLTQVDWLDISLPATTKELYADIRGSDCFYDVIRFIRTAQQMKKRIRLSYTLESKNLHDVYRLPKFSKELEINNIRISHTYGTGKGLIWETRSNDILKNLFLKENHSCTVYTPLTPEKLSAYRRGYLIMQANGNVFRFDTSLGNFMFSVQKASAPENQRKIEQISKDQAILFYKEYRNLYQ